MRRYIPIKNYFIVAFIILAVIGISFYCYRVHRIKQIELTRECYLMKTNTISMQITDLNNIETILMEAPSDYYVYISYTNSLDVLKTEKNLKKVIDKYGINDNFYFIDVTKDRKEKLKKINSNLNISIKSLPTIIYVKNGKIEAENIIEGKNGNLDADEFEELLKDNSVEKKNQ